MNKLIFISFCFVGVINFKPVHAQLITVCSGDSIQLVLNAPYSGTITWTTSSDSITWTDIASSNNDTIYVVPVSSPQFYQANVQEYTGCPIYYSNISQVMTGSWSAGLNASNIFPETYGTSSFYSSSKLGVSWSAPGAYTVDHYEIIAAEKIKGTEETFTVSSTQTYDTISGLKSGTEYEIKIKACADPICNSYLTCGANSVSATTSEEFWQLQGTGDTTTTLKKIVSDGNTLNYAFVYGSWAPPGLEGYIRYYYNPNNSFEKGAKPAISTYLPQTNIDSTVINFTGLIGNGLTYSGWTTIGTPKTIGQSAAIPYNGKVRLFFEAEEGDGNNRIYFIDSQDGYLGLDFNSTSSSQCTNPSDYLTTGGCTYSVALGIDSDTGTLQNISITDIRQFKIGYPTMDSWVWSGANNTFMTPTFDLDTNVSCGNIYTFTTGYALWDSTNGNWNLQYDGSCPKFFDGMQAPAIVHLGGDKYKLYYNQNETLKGEPHNPQTDTKPMKVFYGYGKNGVVNFEDWENISDARNMNYLWPNGDLLTVSQESKLDDYHFSAPTNDLDFQVQYTNISNGVSMPFVTAAILLNP